MRLLPATVGISLLVHAAVLFSMRTPETEPPPKERPPLRIQLEALPPPAPPEPPPPEPPPPPPPQPRPPQRQKPTPAPEPRQAPVAEAEAPVAEAPPEPVAEVAEVVPTPAPPPPPPPPRPEPNLVQLYAARLNAHLDRHHEYPLHLRRRGIQGDVVVAVSLGPRGEVQKAEVHGSCPHRSLCTLALQTVRDASPFPPPPDGLATPVRITLPLRYRIDRG